MEDLRNEMKSLRDNCSTLLQESIRAIEVSKVLAEKCVILAARCKEIEIENDTFKDRITRVEETVKPLKTLAHAGIGTVLAAFLMGLLALIFKTQ